MDIDRLLSDDGIFSLFVNEEGYVVATSYNLCESITGTNFLGEKFEVFLKELFIRSDFTSKKYVQSLLNKTQNVFDNKVSTMDKVIVTDDELKSTYYYSFSVGTELIRGENESVVVKFANFNILTSREEMYRDLFLDFETEFSVFDNLKSIGHFVIDLTTKKEVVYADKAYSTLLNLPHNKLGEYPIVSDDSINEVFVSNVNKLVDGEVAFSDRWMAT